MLRPSRLVTRCGGDGDRRRMPKRAAACRRRRARVLVSDRSVHNFFLAGPDLVSWDLTALGAQGTGPYRLVVEHKTGCITEHFDTVASGLLRQGELETL